MKAKFRFHMFIDSDGSGASLTRPNSKGGNSKSILLDGYDLLYGSEFDSFRF